MKGVVVNGRRGCVCRMETKNPTMSSSIQAAGAEWLKTANTLRAMKADTEVSTSSNLLIPGTITQKYLY